MSRNGRRLARYLAAQRGEALRLIRLARRNRPSAAYKAAKQEIDR
ncbi:hypothetical protein [Sphingomonas oligophenolica]|nr:hypothetical protein [Sphingomonas oligophenolica]